MIGTCMMHYSTKLSESRQERSSPFPVSTDGAVSFMAMTLKREASKIRGAIRGRFRKTGVRFEFDPACWRQNKATTCPAHLKIVRVRIEAF